MANFNYDVAITNIFEKTKGVKTYQYRDIGTKNFYTQNDKYGNLTVNTTNTSLFDDDAVKNSIHNIFSFIPGEEILDPEFGNSIYTYLYQPISKEASINIKREIISLLSMYQPRIAIQSVLLQTSDDDMLVAVLLQYTILQSNKTYSTKISLK